MPDGLPLDRLFYVLGVPVGGETARRALREAQMTPPPGVRMDLVHPSAPGVESAALPPPDAWLVVADAETAPPDPSLFHGATVAIVGTADADDLGCLRASLASAGARVVPLSPTASGSAAGLRRALAALRASVPLPAGGAGG